MSLLLAGAAAAAGAPVRALAAAHPPLAGLASAPVLTLAAPITEAAPLPLESNWFFLAVEYLATFFCGTIGGMAAYQHGYDSFAIMVAAWFTALGGGTIRDVLIGCFPPVNLSNYWYLGIALFSGVIVIIFHPEMEKMYWTTTVFDALALALFAIDGTTKGIAYHMPAITAVFLGLITGVGGGVCRDIIINEVPMVIKDRRFYAVPALGASVLTVFVCKAYIRNLINFPAEIILDLIIVTLVVAVRLLSVKFDWVMPGAAKRTRALTLHRSRSGIRHHHPSYRSTSAGHRTTIDRSRTGRAHVHRRRRRRSKKDGEEQLLR